MTNATTSPQELPDLADILTATWHDRMSGQPPADWLIHTTAALDAHLTLLLDRAGADATDTAARQTRATQEELSRLRAGVREQLAGAVAESHLDPDLANDMLAAFGLPGLRRRYTVTLIVPLVFELNAEGSTAAYDAARDALDEALIPDGTPIDVVWDDVENRGADPGPIDAEEP